MSTNESTPRVGRWTSETTWACPRPCLSPNHVDRASCDVCHAVRPALPALPATPAPMTVTGTVTATIVNADDAQVVGKESIAGVSEAMIDAAMRADGFGYAAISDTLPDLVAQTREWYRRILSAALRAVPVEGGEPVCYAATRDGHPVLPNAIRAHKHEAQRHAELLGPEFYAVPLYAHPAPDASTESKS